MSLLGKLFGAKNNVQALLVSAHTDLFALAGVQNPSDGLKMRAIVHTQIATTALLNDLGQGQSNRMLIDRIHAESRAIANSLVMRVEELSCDSTELGDVLADFPAGVSRKTMINGLAGFEALYHSRVKALSEEILTKNSGPMHTWGSASLVLCREVFGSKEVDQLLYPVALLLTALEKKLKDVM